jgi:ArsR family transcriptional regulator
MKEEEKTLLKAKSAIFKALGHPTRLWMVERLREGELCVCVFADALNVDFSTVSKHLSVLKQAGIVEDDKRGKQVFYKLRLHCLLNFIACVENAINQ